MSELQITDTTSSDGQAAAGAKTHVSLRGMLKRMGKFGLLSTAGVGILELTGGVSGLGERALGTADVRDDHDTLWDVPDDQWNTDRFKLGAERDRDVQV